MGGKDPEPAWEGGEVSGAGPAPPAAGTAHFLLRLPDGTVTLHPVAACRAELQCALGHLVEEARAGGRRPCAGSQVTATGGILTQGTGSAGPAATASENEGDTMTALPRPGPPSKCFST